MNIFCLSKATKYCERAEADLKNVENILRDIGITNIEDGTIEDKLDKVRKNINSLHSKSENLTSKNLSLKVEIDKVNSTTTLSEVRSLH